MDVIIYIYNLENIIYVIMMVQTSNHLYHLFHFAPQLTRTFTIKCYTSLESSFILLLMFQNDISNKMMGWLLTERERERANTRQPDFPKSQFCNYFRNKVGATVEERMIGDF